MAWKILFGEWIGQLSLFVILFIICMGVYIYYFVRKRTRDEEQQERLGHRAS